MDFTNTTDKDDNHHTESLLVLSLGIMLVFACIVRYCDYRNKTLTRRNVLIHHNINNDIIITTLTIIIFECKLR